MIQRARPSPHLQAYYKLAVARKAAREKRMKENRAVGCGVCVRETSSGALLLQRPRSRMSRDAAGQLLFPTPRVVSALDLLFQELCRHDFEVAHHDDAVLRATLYAAAT
jgi:hypothetical protein